MNVQRTSISRDLAMESLEVEDIPEDVEKLALQLLHENREGISVIILGFLCNFMVFGIGFSYGIFLEFYTSSTGPLKHYSSSEVALVGTVGTSLTYLVGIFNKTMMYYVKPRNVMILGSIIMTTGLLLAASSTHIYQFILTQGILFGVGSSFLYLPPVVCTPIFFNKHRAIAMGIVYSGTGFGGLVIATLTRYLIDEYGWRWCLRTLALINLVATILASLLLVVPEHQEFRSNNKLFNISQVGSYRVWLQMAGTLLQSAGYLIPLFFMSKYAETLGFSKSQGAMFIGVNNAINAVFKIILGFGADYIGRLNMIIICSLASSISIFALWMVETRATFLSFVVVYGIFSGAIISILPACLVELFGVGNYQALNGLMTFGRGVGNMLGSPIAGLLIVGSGAYSSAYRNCIIYNGVLLFASTFFLSGLWLATTLERGKKSWIL